VRGAGRAAPTAGLGVAAALGAVVVAAASAGVPPGPPIELPPAQAASASVAPSAAGARPATLTLTLRYPMTCGQPGAGPVFVTLPTAMRLPGAFPSAAVRIRGRTAPSVAVHGHLVTIGLPRPPAVICQSITTGTLVVRFMPSAQLGNPTRPGTYEVGARLGGRAFTARLAVS